MALYDLPKRDGIQLGKRLDRCFKCEKIRASKGEVIASKPLEYEEVFKLHINGIEYVACMDHFQDMLGDYVLVHKDDLKEDEVIDIDADFIQTGTLEEVEAHIEEQVKKKAKK